MENQISEKRSLISIIKANLKIIFLILISILIVFFIYLWFDYASDNKKTKLSEKFIDAKILLTKKKQDKALNVLEKIIEEKDNTYSVLSLYLIIDNDLVNDNNKISNYFDTILSISSLKKEDKNLINLKKAIFLSNFVKEQELLKLLNPIINSNSVWRVQATKFLADYYFSIDENIKANQYYSILLQLNDPNIDRGDIRSKMQKLKK